MSSPDKKDFRPEIRVRGVAESMPTLLNNIAINSGFDTRNDYLKVELRRLIDNAPDHLKREPPL